MQKSHSQNILISHYEKKWMNIFYLTFLCSILYSTNYNITRLRLFFICFHFKSWLFYKEIKKTRGEL